MRSINCEFLSLIINSVLRCKAGSKRKVDEMSTNIEEDESDDERYGNCDDESNG